MTETKETGGSLLRGLSQGAVFAIALGAAVGWGAFVLPYSWLTTSGWLGVVVGMAIGGGLIAVIAVNYGVVIKALPVAGGGVAFALSALGRLHGFVSGWCLALAYSGIAALNGSAIALVFRHAFPSLMMQGELYVIAGWSVYWPEIIVSSVAVVIFALINMRGISVSGGVQLVACLVMLVAVAVLFFATLFCALPGGLRLAPSIPAGMDMWSAVVTIIAFAPWAYVGFDTVPQTAAEFNFSPRRAFALLMWGVGAATAIYVAMAMATAFAVADSLEPWANEAWPTASIISHHIGPIGDIIMIVAVAMGVLTGLNGFYVAAGRVLLVMGRANMLPDVFARVSRRRGVPYVGILAVMLVCLIAPWFGRQALLWVVDMTSVGIAVTYFYTSYCAYRIGRFGFVPGMAEKIPASVMTTILGVIGCLNSVGFLALLLIPAFPGALGLESLVALCVWFIAGATVMGFRWRSFFGQSDERLHDAVFGSSQSGVG